MRRYLAEAIGTFALVFTGTGAIVINDVTGGGVSHLGVALTFGLIVMAMIYAVGNISGAHLNPAVTAGFVVARQLKLRYLAPYILSQIAGALFASIALLSMFGERARLGSTTPLGSDWQSFALEAVLTSILMFVILCVSTGSREVGTMAGIAVGGVIGLEALFAGPISGASMNPARSLAPAIVSGHLTSLWIYLTAPFLGSVVAVPLWSATRPISPNPAAPEQSDLQELHV
jgi:MIP family channel proteins